MPDNNFDHPPLDSPPGQRRPRTKRLPLQVGETVIIGREPSDPVIITVASGRNVRVIKTWMLDMSTVVDIITGALREVTNAQAQAGRRPR